MTNVETFSPRPLCNCPVERRDAPMGVYFTSPKCVLDEMHGGDHRDAQGNTAPSFLGGAMTWWELWLRLWRRLGREAR